MNKHLQSRITPSIAFALAAGGLILLVLAAYALTRLTSGDEVMGRVEVAGTAIGGLGEDDATTALLQLEETYAARPAVFQVEGKVVSLDPPEAGFDVDEEAILEEAMQVGRTGNAIEQFWWWLTHIFATVEIPIRGEIDSNHINEVFDFWDTEVISSPASQGGLALEDGGIVPTYPARGTGVDRPAAAAVVTSSLLAPQAEMTTIPTTEIEPVLTRADVDAVVAEAEMMISGPITLTYNGNSRVFSAEELQAAFRSETMIEDVIVEIIIYFDPETIDGYLTEVRSQFEEEPVDARHSINGDTISVVPGKKGTRIDEEETALELARAAMTGDRVGEMPIVEGADPDITTEYLEGLQINHLVSQFTTYHSCCEPRVTNIQTFADAVDGAVVLPGRSFSLNQHVGQRTEEKGYLPAPTIIAGELEDTIGGGVSQFATTFYNAVFWGGYEDVEHKPHSYYFSRYPEGVEATINWRTPDLVFRNNRSHAILIDTLYTDTSITVRFFGNNDGRTLKGEQSGGESRVWAAVEGGSEALHVKGSTSERFAFTDPGPPEYRGNPSLGLNSQIQVQSSLGGWSVTVTRRILRGGVDLVEEQEWVVRYLPRNEIYEVHPCKVPGTSVACPTTSTLPTSTTTIPGSTTTPPPPPPKTTTTTTPTTTTPP